MSTATLTYNPGMLGDDELIRSFVVRQASLDLIIEVLRENAASPAANRHVLLVGPRGIGKTMLVRRAAAEVWRDSTLTSEWYPIVFGEESYPVGSAGEFWLEALFHLGQQTGDSRWKDARKELNEERDDRRLRERALSQLLDFANHEGRRLLLVVENLNTMLGDQMSQDAAWELRHALQNEKQIMLLATSTSRFDEIDNVDQAWFEMFTIQDLQPLDLKECQALWKAVSQDQLPPGPARAIRILTGGNPRLLRILASFGSGRSFRDLMEQLVRLVDEHTEYFKSHLDGLGPQERRVFVAILENWDPIGARELASAARLSVNETSVLLGRLQSKGAVEIAQQDGRRRLYQASERLYNIYYLMRRRGERTGRVHAAVSFMVTLYGDSMLGELASEACHLPEGSRADHYLAFEEVLRRFDITTGILLSTLSSFLAAGDVPGSLKGLALKRIDRAIGSAFITKDWPQLESLCRKKIEAAPDDQAREEGWVMLCAVLALDRPTEAQEALGKALGSYPIKTLPQLFHPYYESPVLLALAMLAGGESREAYNLLETNLETEQGIKAALVFAVVAALQGRSDEVIEMLVSSKHADLLEPLIVGLRLNLGQTPAVAKEILEAGRDLASFISRLRERKTDARDSGPVRTEEP
jgi:hypothetical protein